MLLARDGGRLRTGDALFWAASWGLGAALGVAAGGWLTLVGGSGAPGVEGLVPMTDLVVLPSLAFVVVAGCHLVGQIVASALRGRSKQGGERKRAGKDR